MVAGNRASDKENGATQPRASKPRASETRDTEPRTSESRTPDNVATEAQIEATRDIFGIRFINPTLGGGTYWLSNWGGQRAFTGVDPIDPWFDADHGSGSYKVRNGTLQIGGDIPRMYVHDPARERQWRDVEITMYFRRVADTGIPFAGMTAVARANHLATEEGTDDLCDTRGYGARMRFDGNMDFEKETAHPRNATTAKTVFWADGLPFDKWIGYKFLVYDTDAGVKLELWLDSTEGRDGGTWRKINEITDDGHLFGDEACADGIDAKMALTNSPDRPGSESGKPNLTVYFRSDGIAADGLHYKWGSIREISRLR
jgi:hypothetical protein